MQRENLKTAILYASWLISLAALAGSLYFSEIRHLTPCVMCWYQRICIYPLLLILTVGILRKDEKVYFYVLPLAVVGAGFALYHTLLQAGVIAEKFAPCVAGISCAVVQVQWFGFVTLPMLSLAAFGGIIGLMLIYRRLQVQ